MRPNQLFRKGLRYLGRWIMLPQRATEIVHQLHRLESMLPPAVSPSSRTSIAVPNNTAPATVNPGEIYTGYSAADLRVFEFVSHANPQPAVGFITDFIGSRTRTTSLWSAVRELDGQVMGRPVPHDLFEAVEWIGLLKAVASVQSGRFAMMELGAGWGPWLVAGARASHLRGIEDLFLLGVEADPGRYALMHQHFLDNDLDPAVHQLVCAAVGVETGRARWPRIADPANDAGARPVEEKAGHLNESDKAYMQGAIEDFIEVEIVSLSDLLKREPVWSLVHIDVQGWEARLCAACVVQLTATVCWLIIGTHSRPIEGQLIETLHGAGWILENEKPARFQFNQRCSSIEQMTTVDGEQVWRNPTLSSAPD